MSPHRSRAEADHSHPQKDLPPPLALKQSFQWTNWPIVTVTLFGLQLNESTLNLWRNFSVEGTIVVVEIFESRGKRERKGQIKFSPPPKEAFWSKNNGYYLINAEDSKSSYKVRTHLSWRQPDLVESPLQKDVFYDPQMKLSPSSLQFGVMIDKDSMMPLQTVQPTHTREMSFTVDLRKKIITTVFKASIEDLRIPDDFLPKSKIGRLNRINTFMFQIPFGQLKTIHRIALSSDRFALLISLDSPPSYFRKKDDVTTGHSNDNLFWTDSDTWYRQTDIVYDPYRLKTVEITLYKEKPFIDIGRWTTYLFSFGKSYNEDSQYNKMKCALHDFNIEIVPLEDFRKVEPRPTELWSLLDPPESKHVKKDIGHWNNNANATALPFEVRYQLEVCISHEYLNEHNITRQFVETLSGIALDEPAQARNILEYVASQAKRVYDPMSIFQDPEARFSHKTDIPDYCAYARKATVTPSTIYFGSPTVETTNRILRRYAREHQDGRFLRVQFTDEMFEGSINACVQKKKNDEIFTRMYRTLYNGIKIGDRHYQFLAFGNSQFRENGAYLFCPTDYLSCDDIRNGMGNFSGITVVAKYAARLGQCFSTTRAINGLPQPTVMTIPDVERNSYCFTDGVGKISPYLAQMIATELDIKSNVAPSAFQFRLGGCKGILVVWPDVKDKEIHIRPSQHKFAANYQGLEVIRCARPAQASLNRQTIILLSALGVPDKVFNDMLDEQLRDFQTALLDKNSAIIRLSRYIDENKITINIVHMIQHGFMARREPFVMSLLHLWRSWSIKLLKEKAKIIVEKSAFVLGCVDETATLRGYFKPTVAPGEQYTVEDLPQIFLQVPVEGHTDRYNVIEGICLVGRNPSLHPGDLRVVQAVNVSALHHLRDVVVFPQTGERDVPSMCSGGDLDGDDFFVIWDKGLQPTEWNCEPMSYAALKPLVQDPVRIIDLIIHFVRYAKNDSLPTIALTHLAQSDYLSDSVKDPKCIELASLHSKAVDYVKTGQAAELPRRLMVTKWPDFMERKFKPKSAEYPSWKILGQLYRKVERVAFIPQWDEPFDERILRAYKLENSLLKTVRQIKSQYDTAMRRIMANTDITTEFEVWTAFVLSKPRVGSDYKVQEKVAGISATLKDQFRTICTQKAGSKDFAVLGPFVAGMYQVTKEELDIALHEFAQTKIVGGLKVRMREKEPKSMPLISFPWLFERELARIAIDTDAEDDFEDVGLVPLSLNQRGKQVDVDDIIRRENGRIIHRGEDLALFHTDPDDLYGASDYEEDQPAIDEHSYTMGESGEVVMDTVFHPSAVPSSLLSGTGVEDVVPRTELDGLINPQETTKQLHKSATIGSSKFNDWDQNSSSDQGTASSVAATSQRKVSVSLPLSIDYSDSSKDSPASVSNEAPFSQSMADLAGLEVYEEEEVAEFEIQESLEEKLARLASDFHQGSSSS